MFVFQTMKKRWEKEKVVRFVPGGSGEKSTISTPSFVSVLLFFVPFNLPLSSSVFHHQSLSFFFFLYFFSTLAPVVGNPTDTLYAS